MFNKELEDLDLDSILNQQKADATSFIELILEFIYANKFTEESIRSSLRAARVTSETHLLKFLNDWLGERKVIMLAFTLGTITNLCYGLAHSKAWIYIGVSFSAFSGIAFPAISAIKSNNVVGCKTLF